MNPVNESVVEIKQKQPIFHMKMPYEIPFVSYWSNIKHRGVDCKKIIDHYYPTSKASDLIVSIPDTSIFFPPLNMNSTQFTMSFENSTLVIPKIEYKILGETKESSSYCFDRRGNLYRNVIVYTMDTCHLNHVYLNDHLTLKKFVNLPVILDELIFTLISYRENIKVHEKINVSIPVDEIVIHNFNFHFKLDENQQGQEYLEMFMNHWNEVAYELIYKFLLSKFSDISFFTESNIKPLVEKIKKYKFYEKQCCSCCCLCDIPTTDISIAEAVCGNNSCESKELMIEFKDILKIKNGYSMRNIKWTYGDVFNTIQEIQGVNKDNFIYNLYDTLVDNVSDVIIYVCKNLDIEDAVERIVMSIEPLLK